MLKIDLTLEDSRLVADRDLDTPGAWTVRILDMPTNTKCQLTWTDEQIAAVVALALGGDNIGEKGLLSVHALYEIAEPLFADVPIECRIIP